MQLNGETTLSFVYMYVYILTSFCTIFTIYNIDHFPSCNLSLLIVVINCLVHTACYLNTLQLVITADYYT